MSRIFFFIASGSLLITTGAGCVGGPTADRQSGDQVAASTAPAADTLTTTDAAAAPAAAGTGAAADKSAVKAFSVEGGSFYFKPDVIRVKQGDTVKITFNNAEGFHDWVIDEFNARTKRIQGGATDTIQFIADKKGSFEYYCSVGRHRQSGMKGTLIVE